MFRYTGRCCWGCYFKEPSEYQTYRKLYVSLKSDQYCEYWLCAEARVESEGLNHSLCNSSYASFEIQKFT